MKKGVLKFSFDELNWQYSLEDLDAFKDLAHLVNLSLQKIRENLPDSAASFFVLQPEFHEYREVVREGTFAIPEDSNLITYLAIKNEIIFRSDMSQDDFFKDRNEEVLNFLFSDEMGVNVFVPIVYRFRLLGFVAISLKDTDKVDLSKEGRIFLELLRESLKVNLYAAILVDKRMYELLSLVDLTKKIEQYETYNDVESHIVELACCIVNFDRAVFYSYNEETKELIPKSIKNVETARVLKLGESVSGHVFDKKKPAIINNIQQHVFFNELNSEDFITFSFISIPFIDSEKGFGVLTIANEKKVEEFSVDHLYLLKIITSILVDALENRVLYQQLEKSYFDTVSSLATALEAKDKYTRGHSERVMSYSIGIAEELTLANSTIRDIKYAAILHDIGKIGISESIITKPGRLTPDELEVIQTHPQIGASILGSIDFLSTAKEYVRTHHEKLDGTGYYGLKNGDYPWEATIINLADSYDALTSDRPYRKAIHPEIALRELRKSVGKQFEIRVFDAFVVFLKKKNIIRTTVSF